MDIITLEMTEPINLLTKYKLQQMIEYNQYWIKWSKLIQIQLFLLQLTLTQLVTEAILEQQPYLESDFFLYYCINLLTHFSIMLIEIYYTRKHDKFVDDKEQFCFYPLKLPKFLESYIYTQSSINRNKSVNVFVEILDKQLDKEWYYELIRCGLSRTTIACINAVSVHIQFIQFFFQIFRCVRFFWSLAPSLLSVLITFVCVGCGCAVLVIVTSTINKKYLQH